MPRLRAANLLFVLPTSHRLLQQTASSSRACCFLGRTLRVSRFSRLSVVTIPLRMSSSPSSSMPATAASVPVPAPMSVPSKSEIPSLGLEKLRWQSTFTNYVPGDKDTSNRVREVREAAYSYVTPTAASVDDASSEWSMALSAGHLPSNARDPSDLPPLSLAAWASEVAEELGLSTNVPNTSECAEMAEVLGGSGKLWEGMRPYAACYGGHQFGSWAGQLGDGRAITLGEVVGKENQRWEVQLKGAGKTPYSRFADGRAVMRSSVREFLCSEAMHHLGIPTTRALALVATGTGVVRDMFYTGQPQLEPGAIVTRVAQTFLRLGSYQLPASRGELGLLKKLADYAIEYHLGKEVEELSHGVPDGEEERERYYARFVEEVAKRNAKMVAMWQGVGFVHGVMNTDNFSILGLTIDYGPYGFLDAYDPDYTPNTTDIPGKRYIFESQPDVARWNILQFAQAFVPLTNVALMQEIVNAFQGMYAVYRNEVFGKKLGLKKMEGAEDIALLDDFLGLLKEGRLDYTNSWRALSDVKRDSSAEECVRVFEPLFEKSKDVDKAKWKEWMEKYVERIGRTGEFKEEERVRIMNSANPVYILRNYMAQNAIEGAEKGDYKEIETLQKLLRRPYEVQEGMEKYTQDPPEWASRRGVCQNSCSS